MAPDSTRTDGESTEWPTNPPVTTTPGDSTAASTRAGRAVGALDELGRRLRSVGGVDRPLEVVEVELGQRRDDVHVGRVVGRERPHVAPVAAVAVGRAGHVVVLVVVDARQVAPDEAGDDVAAHVVLGALGLGVAGDRLDEGVRVEDVVAHAREHLVGAVREADRVGRLLQEVPDAGRVVRLDVDDPELVGQLDGLPDRGDGARGAAVDVLVDHLREVHAVDVVGADHDDDVRLLVAEQVERLEDRVATALVPVLAHPLLRRHGRDVVAEHRRHPPGLADVPVQAVRLVLGEHDDLEVAAVDDVGEREVDQAIDAGERDTGFGPVRGERHQPLALPACEHDGQDLRTMGAHGSQPSASPVAGGVPRTGPKGCS